MRIVFRVEKKLKGLVEIKSQEKLIKVKTSKREQVGRAAPLTSFFQKMEQLGSEYNLLNRLYHKVFYHRMVEKEYELARPGPEEKIVHFGCGPLPLTAAVLARKGHSVLAIDRDEASLLQARKWVEKERLSERIEFRLADSPGQIRDSFSVFWLSFTVTPRKKIVKQLLANCTTGDKIIYRQPRSWLAKFYQRVEPGKDFRRNQRAIKHKFGKETVIIEL